MCDQKKKTGVCCHASPEGICFWYFPDWPLVYCVDAPMCVYVVISSSSEVFADESRNPKGAALTAAHSVSLQSFIL